ERHPIPGAVERRLVAAERGPQLLRRQRRVHRRDTALGEVLGDRPRQRLRQDDPVTASSIRTEPDRDVLQGWEEPLLGVVGVDVLELPDLSHHTSYRTPKSRAMDMTSCNISSALATGSSGSRWPTVMVHAGV